MSFKLDGYIDVATRIVEFRNRHPEGSLQQVSYELVEANGKTYLIYTAAAYRTPDDARPGIGTAWEPVPGPTQFTRDSEMQNAETAAWGRAIVAALAADTQRGIASQEEVRNRQTPPPDPTIAAKVSLQTAVGGKGIAFDKFRQWWEKTNNANLADAGLDVLTDLEARVKAEGPSMMGDQP